MFFLSVDKILYVDLSAFSYPYSNKMLIWQLLGFVTNGGPSVIFTSKFQFLNMEKEDNTLLKSWILFRLHLLLQLKFQKIYRHKAPAGNATVSLVASFTQSPIGMWGISSTLLHRLLFSEAQMTPNPSEIFLPASETHQWHENFQRLLT